MNHKATGALAAILLLAAPLAAQDWKGMGRLEGKVLDPDGKPIEGATVKLDLPERGGGPDPQDGQEGQVGRGRHRGRPLERRHRGRRVRAQEGLHQPAQRVRTSASAGGEAGAGGACGSFAGAAGRRRQGDAAYKEGKFAEARAEYEKVLALKPELSATLHEMIARCYSQEGNYAKSAEHLQFVSDADPTNVKLKILLAQEALRANQLDRGMAVLKTIDETTVTDPEIFYNVAVILLNQNRSADAVPYLTKSVTLDPSYVDGYFQRGLAYLGQGKSAEAKADFQKVVELAPTSPQAETAKKALETIK